jgi:hypothetical protein
MSTNDQNISEQLNDALKGGTGPKVVRFALACLSAIPFAGGAIGGVGGLWSEAEQAKFNKIFASWIKLQEDEIKEIGKTLFEVTQRVDTEDDRIRERIESQEYLSLVKKCFRDWSAAESEEKRVLIRNLLCNAAGGEKICGDNVIRMFVDWVDRYSEGHFGIIRHVYKNPGSTRFDMWQSIHGENVREDSAEADLFKLMVHELSVGHVIRQHREKDYQGNFLKSRPAGRHKNHSQTMTSAFDDDKSYELTELGRWFVHYTMNELVPKIEQKQYNG